jgi:hypothetical protein
VTAEATGDTFFLIQSLTVPPDGMVHETDGQAPVSTTWLDRLRSLLFTTSSTYQRQDAINTGGIRALKVAGLPGEGVVSFWI